ncbi:MAG: hypothetical protein D6676_08020 [Cyanobacteria bacterium J003]|nr:MAG: hypothetical protein D6676_08020 [Cyanobacteria bacterium J003]
MAAGVLIEWLVLQMRSQLMWRFMSLHWPKLSAVCLLYCGLAAGLGHLTNLQLDAMQGQAQNQLVPLELSYRLNALNP